MTQRVWQDHQFNNVWCHSGVCHECQVYPCQVFFWERSNLCDVTGNVPPSQEHQKHRSIARPRLRSSDTRCKRQFGNVLCGVKAEHNDLAPTTSRRHQFLTDVCVVRSVGALVFLSCMCHSYLLYDVQHRIMVSQLLICASAGKVVSHAGQLLRYPLFICDHVAKNLQYIFDNKIAQLSSLQCGYADRGFSKKSLPWKSSAFQVWSFQDKLQAALYYRMSRRYRELVTHNRFTSIYSDATLFWSKQFC